MTDKEVLEERLKAYLPKDAGLASRLEEAMNYSFLAGGKRLRPRLMLETFTCFGGTDRSVEPFMAALEMIHSYSLVHDDLPCMDNDTLRRGKPTTWAVYGEDFGVLAGDGLLTYAFETAVKAFALCEDQKRVVRALEILSRKAGLFGMCGGQALDVYKAGKPLNKEELDFIFRLKTGALLEASLMIGGALAGASEAELETLERIGAAVGYAFQIEDDILDVTSTEEELGKPIGSDARNEKTTYVSLYGMEASHRQVQALTDEALTLWRSLGRDTAQLEQLTAQLAGRKN